MPACNTKRLTQRRTYSLHCHPWPDGMGSKRMSSARLQTGREPGVFSSAALDMRWNWQHSCVRIARKQSAGTR
jgi:hypothetical protein